ncbi:MAG: ribosomal protein S18-alanine N-acetyltransferase [Oscillospiraceae bacterium]|jgi:ribosomal-protein-alanine N-acetyltransferase|nr:ribosomal protein S18-alanine N-acetyltransferase [Oscillospiraceae bacterium]
MTDIKYQISNITVRNAVASDLDAICAIEAASFSDPWTAQMLLDDILNPITYFPVAVTQAGASALPNASVVAYADMSIAADEAEIRSIATAPAYRKAGVAAKLLNALTDYAKLNKVSAIYLETRKSNKPAIALYEKQGFKRLGLRKGYYATPKEDAIVYQLVVT